LATSSATDLWAVLADGAALESRVWGECLRAEHEQEREAVFSPLCSPRYALGVETIYEGYLVHYGRPRLFTPADEDTALLLGDYLYAHGLVRIAQTGSTVAVHDLAELISLCAQARAERTHGDGAAWAATTALLGEGGLDAGRQEQRETGRTGLLEELAHRAAGARNVAAALTAHDLRVR
jgi:hypothetical protein